MSHKLHISGFLGYREPVTIDLDDASYGIVGLNTTGDGVDSNGAGKSSFVDAVCWVLFGKTPRRVASADDLIHTGCDQMVVGYSDGDHSIIRSRKVGESQKVEVLKNGAPVGSRKVAEAQQYIEEHIIGIGYEDFLNFVYFTGTATKTFLAPDTDPAERGAVLSRYLKSEVYDDCRTEAGSRLRAVMSKIETLEDSRKSAQEAEARRQSTLEQVRQTLHELTGRLLSSREVESQLIASREVVVSIRDRMTPVVELVEGVKWLAAEVEAARAAVQSAHRPDDSSLPVLQAQIEALQPVASATPDAALQRRLSEHDITLRRMFQQADQRHSLAQSELKAAITQKLAVLRCPSCGVGLMHDDLGLHPFDLPTLESLISERTTAVEGTRAALDAVEAEQAALRVEWEKMLAQSRLASEAGKQIETIQRQIAGVQRSVDGYETVVRERSSRLAEAEARVTTAKDAALEDAETFDQWLQLECGIPVQLSEWFTTTGYGRASVFFTKEHHHQLNLKVQDIEEHIRVVVTARQSDEREAARLEGRIAELNAVPNPIEGIDLQLADCRTLAGHLTFWQSEFPAIRDRIIGRFLPLFESVSNRNLDHLRMVHRVRFALTAETQSGKLIPRFGISVWDGTDWRGSHTYSVGEWGRIAISICFAFRELMLRGTSAFGSRLFLCDEVADRFDQTGLRLFLTFVQQLPGLRLIVSHRPASDLGGLDRIITITKDAGATTLQVL